MFFIHVYIFQLDLNGIHWKNPNSERFTIYGKEYVTTEGMEH